jgi:hypothetical protein
MHRTTFRIDEDLLAKAKAMAARQHRSLNSVMEEALRRMLAIEHNIEVRPYVKLITSGDPNRKPLIDTSPQGLKEFLMREDIEHYLELQRDVVDGH